MADNQVNTNVTATVAGFVNNIQAASNEFNKFTKNIESKLATLATVTKGFIAYEAITRFVGAVANLSEHFANLAENIERQVQITGIAADQLQDFATVVKISGGNMDGAVAGITQLARHMSDAADGSGEAAQAFASLGISVRSADGSLRPINDVLGDIADRFSATKDGATKAAYAMALMGRSGTQLIPILNQGRGALANLNVEIAATGSKLTANQLEQFERLDNAIDILKLSWEGLKLSIMDSINEIVEAIVRGITTAIQSINNIIRKFNQWKEASDEVANSSHQLITSSSGSTTDATAKPELPPLISEAAKKQAEQLSALKTEQDRLYAVGALRIEQQLNQQKLELNQQTTEEYLRRKQDLTQQMYEIEQSYMQKQYNLAASDPVRRQAISNQMVALQQRQAEDMLSIQQDLTVESKKEFTHVAENINSSFGGAIDGVIDGTKSMKQAFSDFARSIISDLAKIAARNVLGSIFGAATGPTGLGGGLGGAFVGMFGGGNPGGLSLLPLTGARAEGGAVGAGGSYLVGERGPELFVPRQNGMVYNEDQMSNRGTVINMTVNTNDAMSFRRNMGQVMADTQMALQRSLRNA